MSNGRTRIIGLISPFQDFPFFTVFWIFLDYKLPISQSPYHEIIESLLTIANWNGNSVIFRGEKLSEINIFIKASIIFITIMQPPVQPAIFISFKQLQDVSETTNPSPTRQLVVNFVIFTFLVKLESLEMINMPRR